MRNRTIMCIQFCQNFLVIARISHNAHKFVIFSSRPDHRGATNINILNTILKRRVITAHRLNKRVKIDHQHINIANPVRFLRRNMGIIITSRQQPTMNCRMQSLHPSIHDFRKPGMIRHIRNIQPRIFQQLRRTARRQNLNAIRSKLLRKLNGTIFVGKRNQGALNLNRTRVTYSSIAHD